MELEALIEGLRAVVRCVSSSSFTGADALSLVERFSQIEKLASAGRTIAAGQVASTGAWKASGAASLSAWMALRSETSQTAASSVLTTAAALSSLPLTREALLAGKLSVAQAGEVVSAASVDPRSEELLLEVAAREGVAALRERCADVRAAAVGDELFIERIRASRYLRHWSERGGAVRLEGRFAPDDAAPLVAVLRTLSVSRAREARRSGLEASLEAHAADALCALAQGASVKTVVHVQVSEAALVRGKTAPGETCSVVGVGPISVSAASKMMAGASVKLIERTRTDVQGVASAGRGIPSSVRTALQARDQVCVVPGCNRRERLEIDHVVPYAKGGRTELRNLARLCAQHHREKTRGRWRLVGGPGRWEWVPARGGVRARAPDDS